MENLPMSTISSISPSKSHDLIKSDHSDAIAALQTRFGKQLSTNTTVREQHGHTMTWLANQPPDAVLTVEDKHEVAAAEIGRAHV